MSVCARVCIYVYRCVWRISGVGLCIVFERFAGSFDFSSSLELRAELGFSRMQLYRPRWQVVFQVLWLAEQLAEDLMKFRVMGSGAELNRDRWTVFFLFRTRLCVREFYNLIR